MNLIKTTESQHGKVEIWIDGKSVVGAAYRRCPWNESGFMSRPASQEQRRASDAQWVEKDLLFFLKSGA
jgi:hypothetical protein